MRVHHGWIPQGLFVKSKWDAVDKRCSIVPGTVSAQGKIGVLKEHM